MHTDHRQRMRERFMQQGFDGFALHEILEVLLYYSIPRRDTNEQAHELLEHFGSLRALFDASVEELEEIPGIGPQTIVLLKMIPELTRRYAMEPLPKLPIFSSLSKIAEFFCRRFIGTDHECMYMMLLNNRMQMIDCICISQGTVNSSAVSTARLVELAMRKKAGAVVLAHNHPNGLAIPSSADLDITDLIMDNFRATDIVLLEHLIIVEDRFCTILESRYGRHRVAPFTGKIERGFYDKFYDIDYEKWYAPPIFEPRPDDPPREPRPEEELGLRNHYDLLDKFKRSN